MINDNENNETLNKSSIQEHCIPYLVHVLLHTVFFCMLKYN